MKPENISVFPMGEKNEAFAQYFVGQSYLNMLSTERVTIGNVTFEPGCRNAYLLTGEKSYLTNAYRNMDYILGKNATGYGI